ncbi:MAG: hypothetical protein AMJ67_09190 [Betaproteobacteria bacterium SG8_41]|nr:MAG: hypothetical protein AMJ67_09190 [Betaproteobacteria bacterium SG8_41]
MLYRERRLQCGARLARRRQHARPAHREMVKPRARFVRDRSPEIAERPVARRSALQEHHVDRLVRQVDMRDPLLRVHQLVGVIVVQNHHAFRPQHFNARRMPARRIFFRQRIADAEVDHRPIGVGKDRPAHVIDVVAGLLEDAFLPSRVDLGKRRAPLQPAHEIHIVGQCVDHWRCLAVALENRKRLRARVVDACGSARDAADAALRDLFLGNQVALFVAPAVSDVDTCATLFDRLEHCVSISQRQCDRLLDQHRLALPDRFKHRRHVLAFAGGNDDRIHLRARDDFQVVTRVHLAAHLARQLLCALGFPVGHRNKAHARMLRRKSGSQGTNTARADDCQPDVFSLKCYDALLLQVG